MSLFELSPLHAEVVAEIHKDGFDENWTPAAFSELIAMPASFGAITLDDQGEPIGFILCQGDAVEAEIITIATLTSARRQGVARDLILSIGKKTKRLFLEVATDNLPARGFYDHMGFKQVGMRKNYYQRADKTQVDALILGLSFTNK